jgi:hypothetical protein
VQPQFAVAHSTGAFHSVKDLIEKIDQYAQISNAHPFVWTAPADSRRLGISAPLNQAREPAPAYAPHVG